MSDEYDSRLELLRKLLEMKQKKQDIPAEMYAEAGLKNGARIKDIESEIKVAKKMVSKVVQSNKKEEMEEVARKKLEEEAAEMGMSVEEYEEKMKERKGDFGTDFVAKERLLATERSEARKKKQMQLNNDDGTY